MLSPLCNFFERWNTEGGLFYSCVFTKDLIKKSKVWQDGILIYCNGKLYLHSLDMDKLNGQFYRHLEYDYMNQKQLNNLIQNGQNFIIENKYLVDDIKDITQLQAFKLCVEAGLGNQDDKQMLNSKINNQQNYNNNNNNNNNTNGNNSNTNNIHNVNNNMNNKSSSSSSKSLGIRRRAPYVPPRKLVNESPNNPQNNITVASSESIINKENIFKENLQPPQNIPTSMLKKSNVNNSNSISFFESDEDEIPPPRRDFPTGNNLNNFNVIPNNQIIPNNNNDNKSMYLNKPNILKINDSLNSSSEDENVIPPPRNTQPIKQFNNQQIGNSNRNNFNISTNNTNHANITPKYTSSVSTASNSNNMINNNSPVSILNNKRNSSNEIESNSESESPYDEDESSLPPPPGTKSQILVQNNNGNYHYTQNNNNNNHNNNNNLPPHFQNYPHSTGLNKNFQSDSSQFSSFLTTHSPTDRPSHSVAPNNTIAPPVAKQSLPLSSVPSTNNSPSSILPVVPSPPLVPSLSSPRKILLPVQIPPSFLPIKEHSPSPSSLPPNPIPLVTPTPNPNPPIDRKVIDDDDTPFFSLFNKGGTQSSVSHFHPSNPPNSSFNHNYTHQICLSTPLHSLGKKDKFNHGQRTLAAIHIQDNTKNNQKSPKEENVHEENQHENDPFIKNKSLIDEVMKDSIMKSEKQMNQLSYSHQQSHSSPSPSPFPSNSNSNCNSNFTSNSPHNVSSVVPSPAPLPNVPSPISIFKFYSPSSFNPKNPSSLPMSPTIIIPSSFPSLSLYQSSFSSSLCDQMMIPLRKLSYIFFGSLKQWKNKVLPIIESSNKNSSNNQTNLFSSTFSSPFTKASSFSSTFSCSSSGGILRIVTPLQSELRKSGIMFYDALNLKLLISGKNLKNKKKKNAKMNKTQLQKKRMKEKKKWAQKNLKNNKKPNKPKTASKFKKIWDPIKRKYIFKPKSQQEIDEENLKLQEMEKISQKIEYNYNKKNKNIQGIQQDYQQEEEEEEQEGEKEEEEEDDEYDESDDEYEEEEEEDDSPNDIKFYLKCEEKCHLEGGSSYSSGDLWILSNSPIFQKVNSNIQSNPLIKEFETLIQQHYVNNRANNIYTNKNCDDVIQTFKQNEKFVIYCYSVWHGFSSSNILEIKPLPIYGYDAPIHLLKDEMCIYAIHAANFSSEISMLNMLNSMKLNQSKIIPLILNPKQPNLVTQDKQDKDTTKHTTESVDDFKSTLSSLNIPSSIIEPLRNDIIKEFVLNEDQIKVLDSCITWLSSKSVNESVNISPFSIKDNCVLVHGTFGAGKSELLVSIILFFCRLLESFDPHKNIRILISSLTNVAVDGILVGLLKRGFNQFARVGSVKKIAKPILKHVLHSNEKAKNLDENNRLAIKELKEMLQKENENNFMQNFQKENLNEIEQNEDEDIRAYQELYENNKNNDSTKKDNNDKEGSNKSSTVRISDIEYIKQAIEDLETTTVIKRLNKLKSMRVVGTTCAATSFEVLNNSHFSIVFLDECSQMIEPVSMLPIVKFKCKYLLAAGDPKQLPPTLMDNGNSNNNLISPENSNDLRRTLFVRLSQNGINTILLRTQYRCHPLISRVANQLFYDNKLLDGVTPEDRDSLIIPNNLKKEEKENETKEINEMKSEDFSNLDENKIEFKPPPSLPLQPLSFVDIPNGREIAWGPQLNYQKFGKNSSEDFHDYGVSSGSYYNEAEVYGCVSIIEFLLKKGIQTSQIGVIALYRAQVFKLKQAIAKISVVRDKDITPVNKDKSGDDVNEESNPLNAVKSSSNSPIVRVCGSSIRVNTVDSFQGGECDIILLSTCRSTSSEFIDSPNRINVALTRSRHHLIIIGNGFALKSNEIWKKILAISRKSVKSYFPNLQNFMDFIQFQIFNKNASKTGEIYSKVLKEEEKKSKLENFEIEKETQKKQKEIEKKFGIKFQLQYDFNPGEDNQENNFNNDINEQDSFEQSPKKTKSIKKKGKNKNVSIKKHSENENDYSDIQGSETNSSNDLYDDEELSNDSTDYHKNSNKKLTKQDIENKINKLKNRKKQENKKNSNENEMENEQIDNNYNEGNKRKIIEDNSVNVDEEMKESKNVCTNKKKKNKITISDDEEEKDNKINFQQSITPNNDNTSDDTPNNNLSSMDFNSSDNDHENFSNRLFNDPFEFSD